MLLRSSRWILTTGTVMAGWSRPDRWGAEALPEPFAISGFTYLGCYFEPQGYRMLSDKFWTDYGMSGCQDWCRKSGKTYAGMELDNQCFCGDAVVPKDPYNWQKDESKCDQLCKNNPEELCGGYGWMALYSQGGGALPTESKTSPSPQPAPQPAPSSVQQPASSASAPIPASSSPPAAPSLSFSMKTQDLGGANSPISAPGPSITLGSSSILASSESQLMLSLGSSSVSAVSTASNVEGSSGAGQSTSSASGSKSTLAPARPLLPQTTSMGGTAAPHLNDEDRKQIPLSGVDITSAAGGLQSGLAGAFLALGLSTVVVLF